MEEVWIVFHDVSPDNNILGVFVDEEEAREYAERIGSNYPTGVLTSPFPVPWRSDDSSVPLRLEH